MDCQEVAQVDIAQKPPRRPDAARGADATSILSATETNLNLFPPVLLYMQAV